MLCCDRCGCNERDSKVFEWDWRDIDGEPFKNRHFCAECEENFWALRKLWLANEPTGPIVYRSEPRRWRFGTGYWVGILIGVLVWPFALKWSGEVIEFIVRHLHK
jgi:hypothetical protein